MGCAMPRRKISSTASGVATPSITANMASFSIGISTRLRHKPRRVVHLHRRLAQLQRQRVHALEGRIARLQPANHLDQTHHRHRIEEVHPDHAVRPSRPRRQLGDRDRRRIRRQDRVRHRATHRARERSPASPRDARSPPPPPACSPSEPAARRAGFTRLKIDSTSAGSTLPFAASRSRFVRIVASPRSSAALIHLVQRRPRTRARHHMGDPVAHRPRAHHAQLFPHRHRVIPHKRSEFTSRTLHLRNPLPCEDRQIARTVLRV